ncbi:MAG TPA: HAD family hydrolase [Verrucomicrobiae bacterium]|nr:HAD family hydrolase [Verrucomicrobiae bacterium]
MREVAIFDIDGTVIKGQSQKELLFFLYLNGFISTYSFCYLLIWFILYKINLVHKSDIPLRYALDLFKGWDADTLRSLTKKFVNKVLVKKIYSEAIAEIGNHREKGNRILLVSNAIDPIVEELAKYLKIPDYLCTTLEIIDGRVTGQTIGKPVYGNTKVEVISKFLEKNNLTWEQTWGYGDHITDVPFLEKTKYQFIVNPNKQLAKIATNRKWRVLYFK